MCWYVCVYAYGCVCTRMCVCVFACVCDREREKEMAFEFEWMVDESQLSSRTSICDLEKHILSKKLKYRDCYETKIVQFIQICIFGEVSINKPSDF